MARYTGSGQTLIGFMATERTAARSLATAAALLLTVVPLTLGACRLTKMPATRLIVFEALAVNAGSALTPIGNPQNLFLWQLSKVSFGGFVWHMLPLVVLMSAGLLVLTAAYGVNVGGFGFMVGSLANLIALRLSGDRKAWLSFHGYAIPALLVAALLDYALLFLQQGW